MSPRRAVCSAVLAGALAAAAPSAQAELYFLIVGGLGGEEKYQEQFDGQIESLTAVARRTTGEARVTVLTGERATREAVEKSLAAFKGKVKQADTFAVFLIGHGSYDGEAYKLNLPGPDIDGAAFAALLGAVPARSQLVVNMTSASGAVLETWAAEGRTLITATKSGMERNATRFAEHWAKALGDGSADINKNGVITAQEAFDYASRETADSFTKAGTLATEHPQLAGGTAARFTVARLQGQSQPATPAVAALNAERDKLEVEIEDLRARRSEMASDAYLDALQALLLKLADVQTKIDAAQGAPAAQPQPRPAPSNDGAQPEQREIDSLIERAQQPVQEPNR